MKTLQLKTLPLLLVELPDNARDIKVFHDIGRPYISYFVGVDTFRHYTDEDIDLIGKLSEIPDEWFENLVDYYVYEDTAYGERRAFRDYVNGIENDDYWDKYVYETAQEAFYSLLEAKEQVYLNGNPYYNGFGIVDDESKWQEARSRTFDPERTYLFTVKTEK